MHSLNEIKQPRELVVTADDFGLTRHATDMILAVADHGALSQVSVLANGMDCAYALDAYRARAETLRIAVHLNLTEGKALSDHRDIPRITDMNGMFRYSILGLWVRFLRASSAERREIRAEVSRECGMQITRVRSALSLPTIGVDGHQHVHMLPFVFDVLMARTDIARVRLPREPLYAARPGDVPRVLFRFPAYVLLRVLAGRNRRVALARGIAHNAWFLGFLFSGRMLRAQVEAGLRTTGGLDGSVEMALHPGRARDDELAAWDSPASRSWHRARERVQEHDVLRDSGITELFARFRQGIALPLSESTRVFRFLISGSTVALVQFIVLFALTEWVGVWYVASATLALIVGFFVSFTLQRFWTFSDRASSAYATQIVFFACLNVFNISVNALGMYLLVEYVHVWYMAAALVMFVIIACESFIVMRTFVFAPVRRTPPDTWLDFWNGEQSIYVSERHLHANFERIARDFLALEPRGGGLVLLDYGCGDALATPDFVRAGFTVLLFDPSALMQHKIRRTIAGWGRATLLSTPADIQAHSVDIMLINSVLQYIARDELPPLLSNVRRYLKGSGVAYIADVVHPEARMVADVGALLGAGVRHGFFFASLFGLVRTFFSDYRWLRKRAGFTMWREEEFLHACESAGLKGERMQHNIGFNQQRMTFRVRPIA